MFKPVLNFFYDVFAKRSLWDWSVWLEDNHDMRIVDADGFDRNDRHSWDRRYTKEEFLERVANCTVQFLAPPAGKRLRWL